MKQHLCACGCGEPIKENRRYVQGHFFGVMTKTLKVTKKPNRIETLKAQQARKDARAKRAEEMKLEEIKKAEQMRAEIEAEIRAEQIKVEHIEAEPEGLLTLGSTPLGDVQPESLEPEIIEPEQIEPEPEPEIIEEPEPETIVMRGMLGYIDDDGLPHQWQKGAIVSDPVEIAMIKSRQFFNYERLE